MSRKTARQKNLINWIRTVHHEVASTNKARNRKGWEVGAKGTIYVSLTPSLTAAHDK